MERERERSGCPYEAAETDQSGITAVAAIETDPHFSELPTFAFPLSLSRSRCLRLPVLVCHVVNRFGKR